MPFGRLQSAPCEAEKKGKQLVLETGIVDNLRHLSIEYSWKAAASEWHSF